MLIVCPQQLSSAAVPCGLVVRIRRSHRRGRGSIPRMGEAFFFFFLVPNSLVHTFYLQVTTLEQRELWESMTQVSDLLLSCNLTMPPGEGEKDVLRLRRRPSDPSQRLQCIH